MVAHRITPDDALRSIGINPSAVVRRTQRERPRMAPRYFEEVS